MACDFGVKVLLSGGIIVFEFSTTTSFCLDNWKMQLNKRVYERYLRRKNSS